MRKTPAPTKTPPVKTVAVKTADAVKTPTLDLFPAPAKRAPRPAPTVAEAPAASLGLSFAGAGGHAWRMSGKHAVAYVRDAGLAGELLATEPRHLARSAMAVYYDRKGKPFAWQVRFDSARWAEVVGRLA